MEIARRVGEMLLLPVVRRSRLLRDLSAFVQDEVGPNGYGTLRQRFIENGRQSKWNEAIRAEMVARFEAVHAHVATHSNRADGLILAEAALSLSAEGDLIECGCFAGGSTAKLSVLAKTLGRRLFVFDSFEGLPVPGARETVDYHARRTSAFRWQAGDCSATLDRVRNTVEHYGEPSSCTFIPGWFNATLTPDKLPTAVALAYTDVVLPSSAGECLRAIWPAMAQGAVYFSRDVAFTNVLQTICDETLWREVLMEPPPILYGAGFGMRDSSPHLGMMVKGRGLSASYIDSLMIDKVH